MSQLNELDFLWFEIQSTRNKRTHLAGRHCSQCFYFQSDLAHEEDGSAEVVAYCTNNEPSVFMVTEIYAWIVGEIEPSQAEYCSGYLEDNSKPRFECKFC